MVKLVRDFFLKGIDSVIFDKIKIGTPSYYKEYKIIDEIEEPSRLYRKALLRREDTVEMIPKTIRDHLPQDFVRTVTSLVEENIFYEKENKIQFSICCEYDDVYTLSGSIRFLQVENNLCKVIVLLYLELNDLRKYINSDSVRAMVTPIIESKIPELFVSNLQEVYENLNK